MSDRLELELAHRLTPVEAPEGLWDRIEEGRRIGGRSAIPTTARTAALWIPWPVAATGVLALAAGALWLANVRGPAADVRQLAAGGWQPALLELQTNDPREIRRWLRQHAGLDVPLPAVTAVQLEGARVVRRGKDPVAAVEYRVGNDPVTLLVARADPSRPLPPHGARVVAWQALDQVYALASSKPEKVEAACQLCHVGL